MQDKRHSYCFGKELIGESTLTLIVSLSILVFIIADNKMVGIFVALKNVKAISPVPGGVGPLTNIALMQNLLENYRGDDIGGTTS